MCFKKPTAIITRTPPIVINQQSTDEILHLVVDDANINRDILKRYLQRIKQKCMEASDGLEVLELVKSHNFKIIWIDIRMPRMDGIDCARILRQNGFKNIIIGLTGQVDEDTLEKCKLAGMDVILEKPVSSQVIYSTFDNYMQKIK